ncbi:MAG TPA: AMP-binding protein, partial [Thermoanaerobaculia bacterium]|nr:AMP-binding protein [Thermoanaerobaculia bacterium]
SGSAPLGPETFAAFRELAGQPILERYGMTETGMLAGNPLRGERIPGTVGRALPGVELRVADEAGQPVGAGGEGEVEVRGPNVFGGYWRAPEKSAESFRVDADGGRWFRTGDVGRIDPATGHLALLGRRSELILSGGFNVYPREIEEVLLAVPGVREAAVVGEPHAEFGQSPVAFLVAERTIPEPELEAHCREQLAAFKRPRRWVFLDALPRNAMGKVEKRRLLGG